MAIVSAVAGWLDGVVAGAMPPLVLWILLNGLDDLVILVAFVQHRRRFALPPPPEGHPASTIAIFVPCWQEDAVIARMLEHNIAAISYPDYHFFVGAYPNDPATQAAVRGVAARYPNVHLALAPHDGPTSKADCLNWVFQRMLLDEQESGRRYGIISMHDAEDLIHHEELMAVNAALAHYGMVQTPVLALPTAWSKWVHGIYCDDFAEFHTKDLPARNLLGGFIPSSGVGTAFRRDALELLAEADSNRIFAPDCLTEDYQIGLRLHQLGVRQLFYPIEVRGGRPLATREFFPDEFYTAWRQRTRWVTGIALQGWEKHGWPLNRELYWFWRDRKGLAGNPASLLANLAFLYGVVTWVGAAIRDVPWGLAQHPAPGWMAPLVALTAILGLVHAAARTWCSASVYGWRFAVLSPVRSLLGNVLNTASTVSALQRYLKAKIRGEPLKWLKTAHAYPSLAALGGHKRRLGEVLTASGFLSPGQLEESLSTQPAGRRLGEHLLDLRLISEDELYEALSLQHSMEFERLHADSVNPAVARCLPGWLAQEHRILPLRIRDGALELASADVPSDALHAELTRRTGLPVRFRLTTASDLANLSQVLLQSDHDSRPAERPREGGGRRERGGGRGEAS